MAPTLYSLLGDRITIHTHVTTKSDGKLQSFCGLRINGNTQHQEDERPATLAPSHNLLYQSIGIQTHKHTRDDGKVQTYSGLTLTDSNIRTCFAFGESSIYIGDKDIMNKDGKVSRYCGFKLLEPSTQQTVVEPQNENLGDTLNRSIGSSHVHPKIRQEARSICRKRKKPTEHLKVGRPRTVRKQGIQFKNSGASSTTNTVADVQPEHANEASTSQQPVTRRKRTEGTKIRTPKRAAFFSKGARVAYQNLGRPTYKCQNCEAIMWYEERNKNGDATTGTTFSSCCQDGKILLPRLLDAPEPLRSLLDCNDPHTSKFREQIRTYNSMFCFTSFGGKIDHAVNNGRGLYTFRISGQNYHRIGSMLPVDGAQPRYAQLYFYDTQNELRHRVSAILGNQNTSGKIDENIVQNLITMLDEHSSVAQAFRMARNWCEQNNNNECELRLLGDRINTPQYNRPTVSEVAVLVTEDFGENTEPRDVIINTKDGALKRISELHQLYMPLQYPLLFPYGETGFHEHIRYHNNTGRRKTKRECLTMREYYCYRIHYRENEGTTLLRGGRLYQQYLVDAYTAIEEQRLRWIRKNQNELRVELYHNLCDAVTRGDTNAKAIGQRIVLPATFTGSPRYMVQNYQDAMALCRALGNPDLFITFTANPKWPEIDKLVSLITGQKSHDRAESVARVFRIKLNSLMTNIMEKEIFGTCRAGVYTIEFQKRGLPHAHILLWLEFGSRCRTPSTIDDLISAEIPSEEQDPKGYKAVTDYMLHGPCGPDAVSASCTVEGKCTKHFPKPFYQETTIDEDGYAVYRRRNTKVSIIKGKTRLDNRFVVPYNRYLLLKYEAHINVEWCNRSRAIKYLFKYLNKGPDRATMIIQENVSVDGESRAKKIAKVDEIKNYLNCRYLSPCEAVWRMFAIPIHYSKPSVIRLTFHLKNQNVVTLRDSESLPALIHKDGIRETMFTEWFELNKRDERARELTYAEIPKKYVWQEDKKTWVWRSERKSIGRIVYCNPAAGPRYYLRMLLGVVKGPKSFDDIKTVNGRFYETYKEACYAYGLLNDDKEWNDAIQEAKLWATGAQLRDLFVTMLLFCEVSSPLQLWEQNWEALSDDILYKKRKLFNFPGLHLSEEQKRNYCLIELQQLLEKNGKSLDDFTDMPKPDRTLVSNMDNRLIREELCYNTKAEAAENQRLYESLNPEQASIYHKVLQSVEDQKGGVFFVYGPGGTGKTFLYKTILSRLRSAGMIVLAVASSGIASLLLPGGRTAHSRFAIPLELLDSSTCAIKQNTNLAELLKEVKLIIWDEAPMMQRYAFEALDKTLRDILGFKDHRNRNRIFGGLSVLLGGDFRQILPVIPKGKRQEVVKSCINKSPLWKQCEVFTLTRSMRVNEYTSAGTIDLDKQAFNKWVLGIGDGIISAKAKENEDEPTWVEIPQRFIVENNSDPIEAIVNAAFPGFADTQNDEDYLRERAILTPKNHDADEINEHMFKQLDRPAKTYQSSDEICKASTDILEQQDLYPLSF